MFKVITKELFYAAVIGVHTTDFSFLINFLLVYLKDFILACPTKLECDGYFENVDFVKWWVMCSVTGGSY